jgi:CheY-like chemotaxis protein
VSLRVLVVDDEPDMRLLIQRRLVRRGWHVDTAATGLEALDHWRSRTYDAIVVDHRMAPMDGMETARALRNAAYSGPLVLFSAYLEEVEDEAAAAGIATLAKSDIAQLDRLIERLVAAQDA